ncbi:MAG: hypothetical protein CNIPEHKO_00781 [Anaerolineales bacterium]|nr:hypothetical protein [Anaerolineales bacterium]
MLEVIGAGFGRTGTHSLGKALEKLGIGPCYNLPEVANNPEHMRLWNNAIDGRPVDWNFLFNSYKSAVEWPSVAFIYELIQHFPHAKAILTIRDSDSWYESCVKTIFDALELSAHNPDLIKRKRSGMARRLILERTFEGRYRDKEYAIEVYRKHNQHIIETIQKERLLLFDVKDGWQPLCEFLNKPIPNEPFPWLNERIQFMASEPEWARKIRQNNRQQDI